MCIYFSKGYLVVDYTQAGVATWRDRGGQLLAWQPLVSPWARSLLGTLPPMNNKNKLMKKKSSSLC